MQMCIVNASTSFVNKLVKDSELGTPKNSTNNTTGYTNDRAVRVVSSIIEKHLESVALPREAKEAILDGLRLELTR